MTDAGLTDPGLFTITYADLTRILRVSRHSITLWKKGVGLPVRTDELAAHHMRLADVVWLLRRPGGRLRGLQGEELEALVALDAQRRQDASATGPQRVEGDPAALRAVLTGEELVRATEIMGAARAAVVRTRWTDAASVPAETVESILLSPPVLRYVLTAQRDELPVGGLAAFVSAHIALNTAAKEAA